MARNEPGSSNGEQIEVIWLHSRRDFSAGPLWRAQLPNLDSRARPAVREHHWRTGGHLHQCLVQETLPGQFVPVDVHDAFIGPLRARGQPDLVAEFVDGEPTHTFLAKRKPVVSWRSPTLSPLPPPMIVTRNEPDRLDRVERHALAVVNDGDRRFVFGRDLQSNRDLAGVRVVRVLDQLEDGQTRATDQFVAE